MFRWAAKTCWNASGVLDRQMGTTLFDTLEPWNAILTDSLSICPTVLRKRLISFGWLGLVVGFNSHKILMGMVHVVSSAPCTSTSSILHSQWSTTALKPRPSPYSLRDTVHTPDTQSLCCNAKNKRWKYMKNNLNHIYFISLIGDSSLINYCVWSPCKAAYD